MNLHVWAAYRESKTIYEIEPPLGECLARTSWPTNTPTAALILKSHCPILAVSRDGITQYVAITYDYVSHEENLPNDLVLNLNVLTGSMWTPFGRLILTHDDLGACFDAARPYVRSTANLAQPIGPPEWMFQLVGFVLAVLLYLAGEPDIVRKVGVTSENGNYCTLRG